MGVFIAFLGMSMHSFVSRSGSGCAESGEASEEKPVRLSDAAF